MNKTGLILSSLLIMPAYIPGAKELKKPLSISIHPHTRNSPAFYLCLLFRQAMEDTARNYGQEVYNDH
jgi:hypothetical protein